MSAAYASHYKAVTKSLDSQVIFRPIEDVERLWKYTVGGYHPIDIGDLLHDRYRIVDKLGFGGYSTIWLAHDARQQCYAAIKVGISGSPLPKHEPTILKRLSGPGSVISAGYKQLCPGQIVPNVLDEFDIVGPNGTHSYYVTHPAQGSLTQAKGYGRLFPIGIARALAARLILAVAFVHSKGYIHGDIRLSNLLINQSTSFDALSVSEFRKEYGEPEAEPITRVDGKSLPPNCPAKAVRPLYLGKMADEFDIEEVHRLFLADFGEAFSPMTSQRLGKECHTPLVSRAPEAHFEPEALLSFASDIWSLGIAIWDILAMRSLFSKEEVDRNEVIAEQIGVLGRDGLPRSWAEIWTRVDEDDPHLDEEEKMPLRPTDRDPWPRLEDAIFEHIQDFRAQSPKSGLLDRDEIPALLDLMRGMLKFRQESRLTIEQVLQSQWVVNWAMPALASIEGGEIVQNSRE